MNEQEQVKAFNEALDEVLSGKSLPGEHPGNDDLLTFAGELHQLDLSEGTDSLRRDILNRLSARDRHKENIMFKRRIAFAGVALALLLVGLLVVTPAGTYARDFLRRIGGIALGNGPTQVERIESGEVIETGPSVANGESTVMPTAAPPDNLSAEEVEAITDFAGMLPAFVPEGYTLVDHYAVVDTQGNPVVRTSYVKVVDDQPNWFTFEQIETFAEPSDPYGRWEIGDAPITDVLVNGNEAVFIEGANVMAVPDETNPSGISAARTNILIWTQDGFTFTMLSMHLDQETMIAIASSMATP